MDQSLSRVPSLFVSHGLPTTALLDDLYAKSLTKFGNELPALKGIIVVSSHWLAPGPIQITAADELETLHNFYGYQEEIYSIKYPAKGSVVLAEKVAELLDGKNLEAVLNFDAGLDHGAWLPLRRISPLANVPVLQLSLPMFVSPRVIMNMGHALSSLREKGILLIGSGGAGFNQSKMSWSAGSDNVSPKTKKFDEWLKLNFLEAKIEEILDYKEHAPEVEFAHPTGANILPLFFIMGTSLAGDHPSVVYEGYRYFTQSLLTLKLSSRKEDQRIETLQ